MGMILILIFIFYHHLNDSRWNIMGGSCILIITHFALLPIHKKRLYVFK